MAFNKETHELGKHVTSIEKVGSIGVSPIFPIDAALSEFISDSIIWESPKKILLLANSVAEILLYKEKLIEKYEMMGIAYEYNKQERRFTDINSVFDIKILGDSKSYTSKEDYYNVILLLFIKDLTVEAISKLINMGKKLIFIVYDTIEFEEMGLFDLKDFKVLKSDECHRVSNEIKNGLNSSYVGKERLYSAQFV